MYVLILHVGVYLALSLHKHKGKIFSLFALCLYSLLYKVYVIVTS